MIEALRQRIIDSVGGEDRDWEIVEVPVKDVNDPNEGCVQDPKLKVYIKELKKGSVFPPIVLDEKNEVLDGTHRLHAYKRAGKKKVPALRAVGKGTGKVVRDKYFEPLVKKLQAEGRDTDFFIPTDEAPDCLICGKQMTFVPYGCTTTHPAFPDGFPRGPFYFCGEDQIIVSKKSFIGWAAVKK